MQADNIFWGGVEVVPGGVEAFGTEDGERISLGTWPEWDEACDIYDRWSEAHPRPVTRPPREEMMAELAVYRARSRAQWG